MLRRHAVQVLRQAGTAQSEVARLMGISVGLVRAIEREKPIADIDDLAERRRRKVGRPSKVDAFRERVGKLLTEEPEMMSLEVLRRMRLEGFTGGKTSLLALCQELRPKPQKPLVRFEGVAGEFTQHDFGEIDVRFVDGTKRRVHFFATRMKFSRWVEVTVVENQQTETLVRTLVDHFERIGGVPLVAVFDRPKTIVLKSAANGDVVEWNPTFGQVMLELGVGVEVCWPRRGQEKGAVESVVKWVKGSFFKQRRFLDDKDMRQQLAEWHIEINTTRPSSATKVIPKTRLEEERPRLRGLRVKRSDLALRFPTYVGPTGFVLFETNRYSMPPEAIGIAGTLYLYEKRVRIVAGRHEASHDRLFGREQPPAILPEHRTQMVAAVSGKRGRLYLKRQQLLELGPIAFAYLTEIVHRRPRAWPADVERLHQLLTDFGEQATLASMERALAGHAFGAEYVAHHLHDGLGALSAAMQRGGMQ